MTDPRRNPPIPAIPAGTARAAGFSNFKLRRPATVPQEEFTQPVTVDIGPYGVAPAVVFSAAGTATASVGPQAVGETWSCDQMFASTSVGLLDPAECTVYAGGRPIAALAITSGLAGGGSQFGLGGVFLTRGESIWVTWTGGTPGATANLKVTGLRTALITVDTDS